MAGWVGMDYWHPNRTSHFDDPLDFNVYEDSSVQGDHADSFDEGDHEAHFQDIPSFHALAFFACEFCEQAYKALYYVDSPVAVGNAVKEQLDQFMLLYLGGQKSTPKIVSMNRMEPSDPLSRHRLICARGLREIDTSSRQES
jgi:hypothetical protein